MKPAASDSSPPILLGMISITLLLALLTVPFTMATTPAVTTPPVVSKAYNAKVQRILDGDTIRVSVDLGFGVRLDDVDIRLEDVHAPEKYSAGGEQATAILKEIMSSGEPVILLPKVSKSGSFLRSFTRYVGRMWIGPVDVSTEMCARLEKAGLGVVKTP
jgi:endonuclease YncB( thermonuclease family)